jgi:hypothetical protein
MDGRESLLLSSMEIWIINCIYTVYRTLGNYVAKAKSEGKRKFIGDISYVKDKSSLSYTKPFDKVKKTS